MREAKFPQGISTVVFEISYTSSLLRLHTRKIIPPYMSSDWIKYYDFDFRRLSIMVAVFYTTMIRP